MLSRVAILACLWTVGVEGATKKAGFQKIPQFYTSTDCTGPIDAESKLWGFAAKDGVAVAPFATEGAYMPAWAFEKCLNANSQNYAVKVSINATACATNNAANQLVLNYYAADTSCGGTPAAVPLTANTCVQYARGSVKLTTEISLSDLCIATGWVAKTIVGGGVRSEIFGNPTCAGTARQVFPPDENVKECSAEPECLGCCRKYDNDNNCTVENKYQLTQSACQKNGNTWRFALKIREFSSSTCNDEIPTVLNGSALAPDTCYRLNSSLVSGQNFSWRYSFVGGMTVADQCGLVEMALRNNIDPSIVSWGQLNGSGAATTMPTMLALVFLVVATLF